MTSGQEEILVANILDGIRVFDLTIAAVGPWATKLLGALGADVIKVEAPGGDRLSHAVPPMIKGNSVLYISANHNKRMIELDLKKEARPRHRAQDHREERRVCAEHAAGHGRAARTRLRGRRQS